MSLFRKPQVIDRLDEATATVTYVTDLFGHAAEELEYAQAVAAEEAYAAQQAIDLLRDRQVQANTQADRAARVAKKLKDLVA